MFNFFFRRQTKTKDLDLPEKQQASERSVQREDARQAALRQADALAGDESAAVAFILDCPFADARLKAAQSVHSRQALEQVRNAMRNVDRRVTRLVQTRLDAFKQKEKTEQAANACIDAARRLVQESQLTPSQAADLDRTWQAFGDVDADMRLAYEETRGQIAQRLAAQTVLQRRVMDALARLRQIGSTSDELASSDLAQLLDDLATEIAECVNSREMPSLPRNLLPAFEEEFRKLKALQENHEQRRRALAERLEALERWESALPETLDPEEIERQWRSMPRPGESDLAELQTRLDTLLRNAHGRSKPKGQRRDKQEAERKSLPAFAEVLAAFEKSLEEGALNLAAEHDEALRSLALGKSDIDASQAERLSHARSELKRLQEWARWSGRVSRDELIRSVQELPSRSLTLDDLANRVTEARKTWKSFETASGPAPKALWEQFDAACNAAYAPVAERGRKMADERARNAEAAQALIAQVREFAAAFDSSEVQADWKGAAAFYRRARQSWRQLGAIDRKERKRLDAEFEQAVSVLQQPLERQWQAEAARREHLIDAVRALDPKSRNAVDAVRRLQEQWQEGARSVPLGAREEQNLWARFREACDDLFAQRKEAANAADENRRQNLLAKEALCERLENARGESLQTIPGLLSEAAAEWGRIGPEPNADHGAVQKRYHSAVSALQARLDAAEKEVRQENRQVLMEKLALCHAAEAAVTGKGEKNPADWNRHWQALPQLGAKLENMLRSRLDAAVAAIESSDSLYAAMLEANHAQLKDELLRLEILLGLESPAEYSQQRLKVQVEVLQNSLAGNKSTAQSERMDILFSLPVVANEQDVRRMADILSVVGDAVR